MNSKVARMMTATVILGIGMWAGTILSPERELHADSEVITPGSVDDPVVTKSYVDQKVAAAAGGNTGASAQQPSNTSSGAIEIVTVKAGKILIAKDGAEVVVRAGKAVAYSEDSNGIADVTDGKDITNGKPVPNNHLILFPRGGRGIMTAPGVDSSLTVMVRGGYEIK
ncbi:hypothetical protein [Paenibacillus tarimensis]|uniref:hypothetical protein n=1 Tax=Paenibacillus tarimensis TaxID=416012 RepID=UPI001F23CF87|nr:hypothetical protein [Paenibacillus tarimensis]MCF2944141.1 hypothetical protein [Paenibacillus tarimensis]